MSSKLRVTVKDSHSGMIARRGELMAELFLQDLHATFVAQSPTPDFVFDFFVGFANSRGGINTYAIQVLARAKSR